MILLVDIGNTATSFASLDNEELKFINRLFNIDVNKDSVSNLLNGFKFEKIYVSSVAPKLLSQLKEILINLFKIKPIEIDVSFNDLVDIDIDNKNELGIDLLCDIVAGKAIYGNKVVIIDFGTATKVLFIDENGVFSSCAIYPGYQKSKELLANSTELLPNVEGKLIKPISECHNTIDVINSSIYFSHIDTINGIINRYENEKGYSLRRVYTGGNALDFIPELVKRSEYDEMLLFKGMALLINRGK